MLKLTNIIKDYYVGETVVHALKGINVEFRKSEFVSILGASGCGKTTLLNIVGGLDKYTSGDLIINNVSTKSYTDNDWDTYRNHSIGFVFQSYNLISHQSVLNNVELALTLSGVSKQERKAKAIEALKQVGLENEINKKPNQLSGGQMQRVSIARAIVNNPEIILADEPTGALDTITSIQVMDILKEIAKDRLVIMVTHNPELADKYSTRIIRLVDGVIKSDSNPYVSEEKVVNEEIKPKKKKNSAMSFWTAFTLSLNNLMTKKTRTLLTAFAGSIGIIGIALILSLSSGFQSYINKVQEDTLSTYPLTIETTSINYTQMLESYQGKKKIDHELDKIYPNNVMQEMLKAMKDGMKANDLKTFKEYLDNNEELNEYVSDIQYVYNAKMNIYSDKYDEDKNNRLVPSSYEMSFPGSSASSSMMNTMMSTYQIWTEVINNDALLSSQYELLGKNSKWPSSYNEVVVVVDSNNEITDYVLFALGLLDSSELMKMLMIDGYVPKTRAYTYDEILELNFKLVLDSDYYQKNGFLYTDISEDPKVMKNVLDNALNIKVVGIVRAKTQASAASITGAVGYTHALTEYVVENNFNSDVVKEQLDSKTKSVITGKEFTKDENGEYSETEYYNELAKVGYARLDTPSMINIYPASFEAKDKITEIITNYNNSVEKDKQIQYTDYIGLMMSSVTTIINAISYVLISFVSISLVVSSIMIGIITYISVLERTKEIGVLRSIGARKKDISRVFNAETIIIGLVSGLIGIGLTIIIDIPINLLLKSLIQINNIAKLPVMGGIILVLISVFLTFIAGLIPSRIAAKKDPVIALRTE